MAFSLTVEDGSGLASANAYSSASDAEAWLEIEGPSAEWTALDNPGKELMLARASRLVDRYAEYTGNKKKDTQGLEWPRDQAFRYDIPGDSGRDRSISSSSVPIQLKIAVWLLADALASGEFDPKSAAGGKVESLSIPDISVSIKGASSETGSAMPLPERVVKALQAVSYNSWGPRMI